MRSKTTTAFRSRLSRLPAEVQAHARDAYRQFERDPSHRALQFKRVHPSLPIYSARISKGYRAVGQREGDLVVWFWAGTHAEYDGLLRRR